MKNLVVWNGQRRAQFYKKCRCYQFQAFCVAIESLKIYYNMIEDESCGIFICSESVTDLVCIKMKQCFVLENPYIGLDSIDVLWRRFLEGTIRSTDATC